MLAGVGASASVADDPNASGGRVYGGGTGGGVRVAPGDGVRTPATDAAVWLFEQ